MPRGVKKAVDVDEVEEQDIEEVEESAEEEVQPEPKAVKAEKGQEFVITQAPKQQRNLDGKWEAVARVEGTTRPTVKFVAVANSADGAWDGLHAKLVKAGFKKASTAGGNFTMLESVEYNERYYQNK